MLGWFGAFMESYSEYRENSEKINKYMKNSTQRMTYEGELQRIVELHKYAHACIGGMSFLLI